MGSVQSKNSHESRLICRIWEHARSLGWVFKTNHVYLLLTPNAEMTVSRLMQYLGRYNVRYFNFHYQRTGTLYEGRFKSSIVQTRKYLLACQRYIELNPVRAGMVTDPADYAWSSYRSHALGCNVKMYVDASR